MKSRFSRIFLALMLVFGVALHAYAADPYATLAKGGAGGWLNVTRPLTADDMKGRVILMDFWTYGCINCMQVVPDLTYLEEKFGDKLLIIGVHSAKFDGEQGSERILAAAKRFGLKHPVINDSDFAIWKSFGIQAWPSFVVLGPDGKEVGRFEGEGNRSKLESVIAAALPATGPKSTSIASLVDKKEAGGLLSFPARLAYGDGILFVADTGHNRVVGFNDLHKLVMTIGNGTAALKDGDAAHASFNHPRGITVVGNTLYVADTGNHALRAVNLTDKTVSTLAGTGQEGHQRDVQNASALQTALASPWDVEAMPDGKVVIAMAGLHQLWTYDPAAKTVSLLAGTGAEAIDDGPAASATLAQPSGLSLLGDTLYFVDAESSALRTLKNGDVETLIGTGLFDFGLQDGGYPEARMQHAQGLLATDKQIIIADTYNNALRLFNRSTMQLTTVKLKDGTLSEPGDVLMVKGKLFVADTNDHVIKSVDLNTGAVATLNLEQ